MSENILMDKQAVKDRDSVSTLGSLEKPSPNTWLKQCDKMIDCEALGR